MSPRPHLVLRLFLPLFVIAAGAMIAFGMLREEEYDFPLVRDIQKEIEDVTNSTGAAISPDHFVDVAEPSDAGTHSSQPTEIRPVTPDGSLPKQIRIQVPFLVQAPTGNWDMPYQEACEEASIIMAHHYLLGTPVTTAQADQEILAIVAWENDEFNYSADVTMEELKQIAEDYYHHRAQLFYEFSIEDMKKLLAAGHPIIVPLAGRDIGNPYFSGEGPWYHMLVITGYDATHFVTNDPGTRRGEGYRYPQKRLFEAIHNWTGQKEDIRNGRRVMMVLEK